MAALQSFHLWRQLTNLPFQIHDDVFIFCPGVVYFIHINSDFIQGVGKFRSCISYWWHLCWGATNVVVMKWTKTLNPWKTAWTVIIGSGSTDTLRVKNMSALSHRQSHWLNRWVKRRSQWLVRSRPVCIIIQRSPAFGAVSLLQKLEFFVAFLLAVDMNCFFAFGTTWIWIRRHDFWFFF